MSWTSAQQTQPGHAGEYGRPQTRETAVRALGVQKVYGRGENQVAALRGVDVSFEKGAFTAIMGPPAPASRP